MNVRTIAVAVRGFSLTEIQRRFAEVNRQVQAGALNVDADPGVQHLANYDPGGGGGPCAPRTIKVEVEVSASGLPGAEPNDDDD